MEVRHVVSAVAVVLAAVSIGMAFKVKLNSPIHWLVVGGWAIGPPLWFLLEYWNFNDPDMTKFEYFKHGQQVAGSLWAGVLALLYAIYQRRKWIG
jgi:hypothetical protein